MIDLKGEFYVCTLEQAQELKRLGFEEPSYFIWEILNDGSNRIVTYFNSGHPISDSVVKEKLPAYNERELNEMLPPRVFSYVDSEEEQYKYKVFVNRQDYPLLVIKPGHDFFYMNSDLSMAEAKAGMLIALAREKFISIT